jgi:acyl-CoA thioester hydrolase
MKTLEASAKIRVRFSEVDAMAIVWHGSYVKYLEDAREEFGIKYGLDYMSVYKSGYMTPVVKMDIKYLSPLLYEDTAVIKISFIDSPAAKINFKYEIINDRTGATVITAETTQVFIDAETRELELTMPQFFENWKKEQGL